MLNPTEVGLVQLKRPTRRTALRLLALGAAASAFTLAACSTPATPAPPAPQATTGTAPSAPPPAKPTAAQPAAAAPAPTAAPAKVEMLALKMGTPTFQFTHLPVYLGIEQGFFKDVNIDLEMVTMDSTTTVLKALLAKEVNFADMDAAAQIGAVAGGADARIIASGRVNHHYMVAAKKEINSLKDLVGKNVAVSQPNSAPNTVLALLFLQEGIDPSSVNQVAVGGSANRAKALLIGTVDATVFGVDEMDKIEADPNVKMLLLVKDVLPKYVGGGIMMHNDTLKQPGVPERVLEGLARSIRFAFENKDAAVNLAVEKTENPPESASRTWDMFTSIPVWEPNLIITPEQVDYMQEINITLGTQDKKVPADQIIDMSYAEKVIAKLGRYTPKQSS